MAKKAARKQRKNSPTKIKKQNWFFNKINFSESYASLILGAIVVLFVGVIFLTFARTNRVIHQTSSTRFIPNAADINYQNSTTSSTYTVRPGDDLWTISMNFYNNGYKWIEIAKLNNIQNPEIIYSGDKLELPTETPSVNAPEVETKIPSNTIKNTSITASTYLIKSGDTLWDICVRAYGDGYRWPEIAKLNSIQNPDLIYAGNTLQIPR
jgi:nucleoid-associated protein YgaU